MPSEQRFVESLAAEFHRGLAFAHIVAAWFNFRRSRSIDLDVVIHVGCAAYDLHAARKHAKRAK